MGNEREREENGGEKRLALVRQRLLLGAYDSDAVVNEVARRLLASGELGHRPEWARSNTQQRSRVDYRGM
jgi:hypothetical protein